MLGQRGPQRGLFEADSVYGEFVGRETFYGFLASQRGQLFRDEDFAGLYCAYNGRPSVPPSLLATALVLQTYDGVSDDEAKRRADYDLQWKVALGVELDARPFAKSTLQEFRGQLVVHAQQRAIFQRSLELAKRRGKFRGRTLKVALDTTNILGRGAVKDTYNLLADGIVQLARALAKQAGQSLAGWAERQGYGRYVGGPSLKGGAELDWSDPAQRRRLLGEILADAERLLELARQARVGLAEGSVAERALMEAAGLLSRVLVQDIERREDGPALKEGVAPDRLVSVHDPEQRHGRKSKSKRFDGHKVQLATDTDSQLITAVEVIPGNAADAEQALAVVEQSEAATGCAVSESIGDCAYGGGTTRQAFADAERTLIAKVPSVSNQGCFPKTVFTIDLEVLSCRCPAGQTTDELKPLKGGGGQFQFAAAVCGACPRRAECVRGSGGRSVQLHPQEQLLQEARELQASPAFPEYRTRRQVVEHRIARLVQLGLRQARYFGLAKTLFQASMAAAVANLTLLASEQATAAQAAALVAASLALVWVVLGRPEGSRAPGRGDHRPANVNLTTPGSRPWSTPFAVRQLEPPAYSFKFTACRPGS
jgi:transposase